MRNVRLPSLRRWALLLLVVVPICAWLLVKPVRVVAPQIQGITCPVATVCVDDVALFQNAHDLYTQALAFVGQTLSPIAGQPKVIFCSTDACAQWFGLGGRSAVTVGTFGTVIGPRAWHAYYIRHEMIHYLQGEKIGVLRLLFKPAWLVEGMAYSLSQDPRKPLAEPFEGYRKAFLSWYGTLDPQQIWTRAAEL